MFNPIQTKSSRGSSRAVEPPAVSPEKGKEEGAGIPASPARPTTPVSIFKAYAGHVGETLALDRTGSFLDGGLGAIAQAIKGRDEEHFVVERLRKSLNLDVQARDSSKSNRLDKGTISKVATVVRAKRLPEPDLPLGYYDTNGTAVFLPAQAFKANKQKRAGEEDPDGLPPEKMPKPPPAHKIDSESPQYKESKARAAALLKANPEMSMAAIWRMLPTDETGNRVVQESKFTAALGENKTPYRITSRVADALNDLVEEDQLNPLPEGKKIIPSSNTSSLTGEELKNKIKSLELTQREFGDYCGVRTGNISNAIHRNHVTYHMEQTMSNLEQFRETSGRNPTIGEFKAFLDSTET